MKVWVSADYEGRQGFKVFFLGGKGRDERYEKSQAFFLGERVSHIYIYIYV